MLEFTVVPYKVLSWGFDPLTASRSGFWVKITALELCTHFCTDQYLPPLFLGTAVWNFALSFSLSRHSPHRFSLSPRLAPSGYAARLKCKSQNLTLLETLILCHVQSADCQESSAVPHTVTVCVCVCVNLWHSKGENECSFHVLDYMSRQKNDLTTDYTLLTVITQWLTFQTVNLKTNRERKKPEVSTPAAAVLKHEAFHRNNHHSWQCSVGLFPTSPLLKDELNSFLMCVNPKHLQWKLWYSMSEPTNAPTLCPYSVSPTMSKDPGTKMAAGVTIIFAPNSEKCRITTAL